MESPSSFKQPPVDTFKDEGATSVEVECYEYPHYECEGATIVSGKIAPGRNEHAGSN